MTLPLPPSRVSPMAASTNQTPSLPACGHAHHSDNTSCAMALGVDQRIVIAKQTCQAKGIRFTALREQVFRLILQATKPIGAYDLLAQLQKTSDKTIAPPTVYRSLDFLLKHGFIHQLSSSNAFFACCQPDDKHVAAFLICQHCGDVQEFGHSPIDQVVQQVADQSDFDIHSTVIELLGRCQHCKVDTT